MTQCLALRADPVGFALWAYPWGVPGTPLADLQGPRPWQVEELAAYGEHIREQEFAKENGLPLKVYRAGWSSGRGLGKSAVLGIIAHHQISTHFGSSVLVAANTESQLRTTTFPEFARWFGMAVNAHWFAVEGMKISIQNWLSDIVRQPPAQGGMNIDPENWNVQGKTWTEDNPSAFVGPHNAYGLGVIFDEGSGIHSSIWDRTEGFFTEINPYRFWLTASQMRNRQGRFYEIFNDSKMGKGWRARTLSTRGMVGIDQAHVEDQITKYGEDSDYVRVEILGLPPRTSSDQFIPFDTVRAAMRNELFRDYGEPLILGVDPAPRGKTAWAFRQGRNARDCCGSATSGAWSGYDNVQIANEIINLDNRYKPEAICIDFGMGTGVIDILKRRRLNGRLYEVKFGDSPHDKSGEWATHAIELWARMREWLSGGMIPMDNGEKDSEGRLPLSGQLTDRGWRFSGREDGKKILETKDDMARRGVKSPDNADALACTFEVNPPRTDVGRHKGGGNQRIAGYEAHPDFD